MCEYLAYWHRKSGEGEMAMENKAEVMVAVICFNHEEYIAQCLDSVFAQQCNFDYRVCVFDDCSTDRSMDIARSYQERYGDRLQIIQPETNQYKLGKYNGAMRAFFEINDAKYMAFCEGDDYWTDKNKLQKQFEEMERNRDATLCICDVKLENVINHQSMGIVPGKMAQGWTKEEILNRILTYQLSFRLNGFLIRTDIYRQTDFCNDYWNYWAQDNAIVVYCLLHGNCVHLSECMAVKRMNNEGSFSQKSNIEKNIRQQIGIFESDIEWIGEFQKISMNKYEYLVRFFTDYRKIKLFYLYRNELNQNKWVSNVNGRMYTKEFSRKINRLYVKCIRNLYGDRECKFVKQKAKWMEKEWKRLQNLS